MIRTLRAAVVCLLFFALLLACANYAIHKAHARECSSSSAARAEWLGCPTHAALPAVEEVATKPPFITEADLPVVREIARKCAIDLGRAAVAYMIAREQAAPER